MNKTERGSARRSGLPGAVVVSSLALAGAVLFPAGNAWAEGSWEFYARLNVSTDYLNDGEDGALNFSSNSSRVGLRGRRDLQPQFGLIWQVEQTVDVDIRGGQWATRNTYLGVRGDAWGDARLGHHDTPVKRISRNTDLFGEMIGDSRNLLRTDSADGEYDRVLGWDERFRNSLLYTSPSMAGFQAAVQYSTDQRNEGTTNTSDHTAWSGSLTYAAGPLWLGVGHEGYGRKFGSDPEDSANDTLAGEAAPSVTRLGARYRADGLTLTALYQQAKNQRGVKDADRDVWGVGAGYDVAAAWTVKAQYYAADSEDGTDDTGATMVVVGFDYRVAPDTLVYGSVARADNDDNAAFVVSHGGRNADVPAVTGEDPWGVGVGLRYAF